MGFGCGESGGSSVVKSRSAPSGAGTGLGGGELGSFGGNADNKASNMMGSPKFELRKSQKLSHPTTQGSKVTEEDAKIRL